MQRSSNFDGLARIMAFAMLGIVSAPMSALASEAGANGDEVAGQGEDASVLTGAQLEQAGAFELEDLANLVPGLTISTTRTDGLLTARIRGMGGISELEGPAGSIGLVVDGVTRPRLGAAFVDLGDVERVTVLKGPQDVLLGHNTSAGAIDIVTRKPEHELRFLAGASLGSDGLWGLRATINSPLGDGVAVRVTGLVGQRDGFTSVSLGSGPRTETRDDNLDVLAFRGQLLVEPSSDFSANLSIDYARRKEDCCLAVTLVNGPTASITDALASDSGVASVADPFARAAFGNRSTLQDSEELGGSLHLDWDSDLFGGAKISSITALRRWQNVGGMDGDHSSADLFYREPLRPENFLRLSTYSQELRFAGKSSAFDWMIGASYQKETLDRTESIRIGPGYEAFLSITLLQRINPLLASSPTASLFLSQASGRPFGTVFAGQATLDRNHQESRSIALFTANTWHATDRLDVDLGLRYTFDRRELASEYTNPNSGLGCSSMLANPAQVVAALVARGLTVAQASAAAPQVVGFACLPMTNSRQHGRSTLQESDSGDWSGSIRLSYRVNDNVTLFGSAARGYKQGGYVLDRMQSSSGLSSGTAGIIPVNDTWFPAETVQNYELGARTRWADGRLQFNLTLFRQEFSDYQFTIPQILGSFVRSLPEVRSTGFEADLQWRSGGLTLRSGLTYADTRYGDDPLAPAELALLPGSRPHLAPEWTATGSIDYVMPIGDKLQARAYLGAHYQSEHNTGSDLDPLTVQKGYALLDARLGFGSREGRWNLDLWVKNLTDVNYLRESFDPALMTGSINSYVGAPRTYGATVRLGF